MFRSLTLNVVTSCWDIIHSSVLSSYLSPSSLPFSFDVSGVLGDHGAPVGSGSEGCHRLLHDPEGGGIRAHVPSGAVLLLLLLLLLLLFIVDSG